MAGRRVALAGSALLLGSMLAGCSPPQPWASQLVSVNAAGDDSAAGASSGVVSSPDGTKLAFQSDAPDLVPNDTNGTYDVFVRDLTRGTTTLVSVNAQGTGSGDDSSYFPVFSPDGTKIVFTSTADDLVPGCPSGAWEDLYVRDLTTGTTSRVSVNRFNGCGGSSTSFRPVFSPDSTKVAFATSAIDLGEPDDPIDTNGSEDVLVRDLVAGTTTLVSVNAAGTATGNAGSTEVVFGADSTTVAFTSAATDLGPADGNQSSDIYLRDLGAGTTTLVSARPDGSSSQTGSSFDPAFSPDGTRVAFVSEATDLGPVDSNLGCHEWAGPIQRPCSDVYLRDLGAGTTSLVSRNADGTDSANLSSNPVFSPSGTELAFESYSGALGPADTNRCTVFMRPGPIVRPCLDVYRRSVGPGPAELVSANGAATSGGNADSFGPVFSPVTGAQVAFTSYANDLGPSDPGTRSDVYVRSGGRTTLVSVNADGVDSGNGASSGPVFAAFSPQDGITIAYTSEASDLGPTDANGAADVYLARFVGADLTIGFDGPQQVGSGQVVTYTVTLSNRGPDGATARVAVLLPEGTTFLGVESRGGVVCHEPTPEAPRLVTCSHGWPGPGGAGPVQIDARVDAPGGSSITALAVISSDVVDPQPENNTRSLTTTVT